MLLRRVNVPADEITAVTEQIYERGVQGMFNIENYDVQETRRVAHNEGIMIGEARGVEKGVAIGEARGVDKGLDTSAEIMQSLIAKVPVDEIAERYQVSVGKVKQIQSVLAQLSS